MRKNSHFSKNDNMKSIIVSLLAFVCALIFEVVTVLPVNKMTSISANYEALYYASLFAGKKWNIGENLPYFQLIPTLCYGYILKIFSGNPIKIWRVMVLFSAFMRSIPAYISSRVVTKYYGANPFWGFMCGILASLVITNRATVIDNNVFVVLFMLILFVLFIRVEVNKNTNHIYIPFFATIITAILLAVDIKLLPLFIVVSCYFSVYMISRKKMVIGCVYVSYSIALLILVISLQNLFVSRVLADTANLYKARGTYQHLFNTLVLSQARLFSFRGLKLLFINILSQFWTLVVFSFGLLLIPFGQLVSIIRDKTINFIGGLSNFIFSLSLIWGIVFDSFLNLESNWMMDYRHYFDFSSFFLLGSFFSYCVPLILLAIVILFHSIETKKNISLISISIFALSSFVLSIFMHFALEKISVYKLIGFFIHNPAFLLRFSSMVDYKQYGYFVLICFFVVILFYLGLVNNKAINNVLILITVPFVLMYLVNGMYLDYTFIKNSGIYSYLEMIEKLNNITEDSIEKSQVLYCDNSNELGQLVQYTFSDTIIRNESPSENDEQFIYITQSSIDEYMYNPLINGCYYSQLDDNNYLYIKGDEFFSLFDSSDFKFDYIDNTNFDNLYRLYVVVLNRYPSYGELEYWSQFIESGDMTYYDIVDCFFLSQEFQMHNYSTSQLYCIMTKFFFDEDFEDSNSLILSNDEKQYWIDMIESGLSFTDLIDEFFESDRCIL